MWFRLQIPVYRADESRLIGGRHGYPRQRYTKDEEAPPLRQSGVAGPAGGDGLQNALPGLRPRGHAAPEQGREKHQEGFPRRPACGELMTLR